ncbi:hypothetical protein EG328_009302 [Venturia inaequalis]|uniref:Uncharacterized protein n=1 Tax=Venturia inaequalis TaxID=5025 RepID=A0A8H3UA88_VENIN|nr:hypothetical protein EG328_009302 [Venturia inaequalis]KAE9988329.1 hypothetical protein EG327_003398 [Venturia inaequalis]RDI89327.1 hypothetical protein Vi05172_g629 [Venturia inaequalis]
MAEPVHSTGRGGAGNAGRDTGVSYTDAGIKREGVQGHSVDGEFSSGRGGAGNMVESPRVGAVGARRGSQDIIPDQNLVEGQPDFHTGRGGGGNIHREKYGGHTSDPNKPSIIEKIKDTVLPHHKEKKAEGSASPAPPSA